MASDGQIVYEVSVDSNRAKADLKDITRTVENETQKWDKAAEESTDNISNSFGSMLKKLSAAFAAAKIGEKLVEIGKEGIELASNLQEVQNVVDVTFGTAGAKKIETWAKNAGTQFGLTETQAKKFTSTLGAMLKSSGMAGDEIVDMSTNLAGLAADMASFYNLDFETAFQKIRSGISGETEPLKQLGINMSVANLNAFALQKGLSKTFEQMSQGEQTMLRYQYIMSATADAQGDFARTSDGYANGMRTLETNIETLKTKLGEVLLPVINNVVAGINTIFPESSGSRHTVLDDFTSINAETESELQKITQAAEDARDLNEILDEIATNDKSNVLTGLANGANALKGDSVNNWKNILKSLTSVNGLENLFGTDSNADQNITDLATALSGASVDQSKAEAWKTFLDALSSNADAVSSLTGGSAEETATWLSSLATAANELDEGSAEGWNTLFSSFLSGIDLETPAGQQFRDALAQGFLAMGAESEEAANGLRALGYDTDEIADKQALWLETCKKLVETIPGLSDIINTETGEVKGGKQAISDYVDEWEKAQKRMVYMRDIQKKQEALDTEFADFKSLELDIKQYEKKIEKQKEKIRDLYEKYGYSRDKAIGKLNPRQSGASEINEQIDVLSNLQATYVGKQDSYNNRKVAYDQAVADLEERKEVVEELVGALDEAEEAETEWTKATKENARTALEAANGALAALNEHIETVRNNVKSAVNSTISGFEKIGKAGDELREKLEKNSYEMGEKEHLLEEYGGASAIAGMSEEEWKKLPSEVQTAYNEIVKLRQEQDELNKSINAYSPQGMIEGLQSQIDYMDEYMENLDKAKALGLSDDLLSMLSDGSKESAEYLAQIAGADSTTVQQLNDKYAELQQKKEGFTDTLTDQKLTVDEVYKALLEDARQAVDALNMEETAKENSSNTVKGVIEGINANVPGVQDAVNSILSELAKLASFKVGFSYDIEGKARVERYSGSFDFSSLYRPIASNANGLDYVPYDGHFSILHKGESILTAEEAKVWRQFANSGSIDYDTMGGVMRDNIKPGGNVYLDGRIVGSVISDQQGKSFRQLNRSGWQS
jgi:hypothetical protein